MKYLGKSFTVAPGKSDAYRNNYDKAFSKETAVKRETELEATLREASNADFATKRRLVVIESPYSGDIVRNLAYVREAMRDCLKRREAPYASHALYTQPGVLDDNDPDERQLGIDVGLLWGRAVNAAVVVYADYGITPGMVIGINRAKAEGREVEIRHLYPAERTP
jgi:hypothetical protein